MCLEPPVNPNYYMHTCVAQRNCIHDCVAYATCAIACTGACSLPACLAKNVVPPCLCGGFLQLHTCLCGRYSMCHNIWDRKHPRASLCGGICDCMHACVAHHVVHVWQIMPLHACLWGRSNLRSKLCDYMCGRYSFCSKMCACMHAFVGDKAGVAEYATACIHV